MSFLDSAHRRRVSRREITVELGPQAKFVVLFSVAIGTSARLVAELLASDAYASTDEKWASDCS
jgi:hypothetical protein